MNLSRITVRLIPFRIFLPSIEACKSLIININFICPLIFNSLSHNSYLITYILPHASFQTDLQQLLCFNSKFHWEFVDYFPCISIDNYSDGIFSIYATLVTIKNLVLPDLRGCCLMFNDCRIISHFDIWEGMSSAFVAKQKGITLRKIPGICGFCQDPYKPPELFRSMPPEIPFETIWLLGIFTHMDHLCTSISLLIIICNSNGIKFAG